MIVISGALVVVALVLLVFGVTKPDLNLVYGSIVLSLVSLVFLVLGIVQRRGEALPATSAATPKGDADPPAEGHAVDDEATEADEQDERGDEQLEPSGSGSAVVAAIPASRQAPSSAARGAAPATGSVLVVANRPRYHVEGCRYLAGKQVEEADVEQARADGFTACGVCKPDVVLAQVAQRSAHDERADQPDDTHDLDADSVPSQPADGVDGRDGSRDSRPQAVVGPARQDLDGGPPDDDDALDDDQALDDDVQDDDDALDDQALDDDAQDDGDQAQEDGDALDDDAQDDGGPVHEVGPEPAGVGQLPSDGRQEADPVAAPAPAARGSRPLGAGEGDGSAAGSSASAPAPAATPAATKTAAARASRPGAVRVPPPPRSAAEQVVVIPDRNRYHRAECRHVRGLAGAEELSTAQAAQQGYSACGVCKP